MAGALRTAIAGALRGNAPPWISAKSAAVSVRSGRCLQRSSSTRRSLSGSRSSHHLQEMHVQQMKDLRSQAAQRGPDLLLQLSEMACTPVELTTLFNLGKSPTPDMLMDFAQFLHRELSIRMAQRAVELARLPHGLSDKPTIRDVCGWYAEAANQLVQAETPNSVEQEQAFTTLLKSMLRDHTSVVRNLAVGCMEVKGEVGPTEWERIRGDIDRVLTAFYTSRIGLRFLMEQVLVCMRIVCIYIETFLLCVCVCVRA